MPRPNPRIPANPRTCSDLKEFLRPLHTEVDTLYKLSYRLSLSYQKLASTSLDEFFPTAITCLPTEHETGRYLAVYVGLSYLRIAFIDLLGDQQVEGHSRVRRTLEKAWPIEEHLRRDHAPDLFTWIGDCIAEVVADSLANPSEKMPCELTTGISLCFPVKQKSLDEAVLMPTGKGFALNSDLNLRQALLSGYERHTRRLDEHQGPMPAKKRKLYCLPSLRIAVMTNDTVATLASLAYFIPSLPNTRVVMGLITRHIRAREPDALETLVSTEWTLSSAAAPLHELGITTSWDTELDMHSQRPGFQPFEYMVGGRYIGELVRIICYDWFNRSLGMARSALPLKLVKEYSLTTDFLSLFVASNYSNERLASDLSKHLPPPPTSSWRWTPNLAGDVRAIASAVQDRAASLVAAAVVGLLACTREIQLRSPDSLSAKIDQHSHIAPKGTEPYDLHSRFSSKSGWRNGPEELAVAVSGGVIQHYPHYKETVQRYIDRLILCAGPQEGGRSVFLREVSDGGIIGIGVLAGTASGEIGEIIGSSLQKENTSHGDPKTADNEASPRNQS
ncbi:hypothetical protein KXW18_003784 [Aspergillus fumigatus]|nr:hypothetical protein KXX42_001719 [Aspergillus fumigatus]KAH2317541.1 hypothetical protein KXV47_008580 [Aspergillus fumigatus]KAH3028097.1 hypothetical protein KXW60_003392 [Aspergillus fumigatus]KAH3148056.1 hypothetical protein KXW18_003784 [Aspergillus fumigatus]